MQLLELGIISAERPLVLLGCGNMGRALLSGWRAHGLPAEHIFILDPALADGVPELDIEASQVGQSVPQALRAGLVMLAIKPQVFAAAAPSSAPAVDGETAILSIMAGVPVRSLEAAFPHNAGCVRAMPNTPAAIGKGITALYAGPDVVPGHRRACEALMQASGRAVWVESEADLNTVTAISGSGPAYVFCMMEALKAAGVKRGLSDAVAQDLAIETVAGAGALATARTKDPSTLRVQVTSPNGTTEAGLSVLMDQEKGLLQLIEEAVNAAHKRAEALAKS